MAGAGGVSRPMKYPYTMSAKLAQFPYKYYWKNSWPFRYFFYGIVAAFPFFLWVDRKVNSPAAVAAHRERLRKEAALEAEHGHH